MGRARGKGRRLNRKNFDRHLLQLADRLGVDVDFETRGNAATDEIFEILKEYSKYELDRLRIFGGKAKRTSLRGHADYDCVVFVNIEEPPFYDVIMEFKELLARHLGKPESDFRTTPFSLHFTHKNVDFDLLPAHNEVQSHENPNTVSLQVSRTLEKIKAASPDDARYHSSAAVEGAVAFIKSRPQFVKRIIKLSKHWNHGVDYGEYIAGRSTLIETIATQAAEEAISRQRPENLSERYAFTEFLRKMRHLDKLDVRFYEYYDKGDVPHDVSQQRPLVLDVTNPKNNLMDGLKDKPEARQAFQRKAKETLRKILDLNTRMKRTEDIGTKLDASDIEKLF